MRVPLNIYHDGHEFLLTTIRKKDGSYIYWYNWVFILGSQRIADKFEFVMTFVDKDGKDVIMYRGNVISIDVPKEDMPKIEGSVFLFHDPMVRKIWDDQRIRYKLTVQNK